MIQYNTKNTSFLKMHYILKEMGIKNNTFFLQLYDKTLFDVDPLNEEELTEEQKLRIHIEISKNPWYFFREIVKIPMTDTKLDFELHRGTLAILWTLLNDLHGYVVLPRQSYKSYTVCVFYCWILYWGSKNFTAAFFAQNDFLVTKNLRVVKDIRDALPKYLNMKTNADTDNTKSMFYRTSEYTNSIIVRAPGMNEDSANNVGRGASTMGQWWDEFAFIPYVWTQYGAAVPAYSTVAKAAERNGSHHHIMITTTAGYTTTKQGQWAYEFFNKCAPFTELLYDKVIYSEDGSVLKADKEEIQDYIANNNTGEFFLRIEYMWYEISKPMSYLTEMKNLLGEADEFRRGVLNVWADSNSDHPLGQERVQALVQTQIDPVKVLMIDKIYVLKFYRDPNLCKSQSSKIVFGMDTGGNTRRDYSTLVGVDITNSEVVCTMRVNQYSTLRFAKAIAYIMCYLFPKAVLVGERNYIGGVVLEYISKMMGTSRIYKDDDNKLGVKLYHKLREIMYGDVLRVSIIERGAFIHDKTIIEEIAGLQTTKSGRIDHKQNGGHDDTLIAYLYCRWFIMFCKTKRRYFDEILFNSNITQSESEGNDEDDLRLEDIQQSAFNLFIDRYDSAQRKKDHKKIITDNSFVTNRLRQSMDEAINNISDNSLLSSQDYIDNWRQEITLNKEDLTVDIAKNNKDYHEYSENLDKDDPEKISEKTEDIRDSSNDPINKFKFNFLI